MGITKKVHFEDQFNNKLLPYKNRIKCMRPVNKKRKRFIPTITSGLTELCKLCKVHKVNSETSSNTSIAKSTRSLNQLNTHCHTTTTTATATVKPKKIIFLKSSCVPGGINYMGRRGFLANKVYNYLKRLNKQWRGALVRPKGNQINCVDKFKRHNSTRYLKDRVRKNILKGSRPKSGKYFSKIKKIKKKSNYAPSTFKKIGKIVAESLICGLKNGILERDGYNFTLNKEYRSVFDMRFDSENLDDESKEKQSTYKNHNQKKVRQVHSIEETPKQKQSYDTYSSSKSTIDDSTSTRTESTYSTSKTRSSTSKVSGIKNRKVSLKKPNKYAKKKRINKRPKTIKKKTNPQQKSKKKKKEKYKLDTLYFPEKRIKLRKDLIMKNVKIRKRKPLKKRNRSVPRKPQYKSYKKTGVKDRKRGGGSSKKNTSISNPSSYITYTGSTSISSYSCVYSTPSLKTNSCYSYPNSKKRKYCKKEPKEKRKKKSIKNSNKLLREQSSELNLTPSFQKLLEQKKKSKRHKMLSFIYKIKNWIKYQHLIGPWFSGNKRLTSSTRSIKNSMSRSSKISKSVSTKSCLLCNMKPKRKQHGNYLNKSIDSISLFDAKTRRCYSQKRQRQHCKRVSSTSNQNNLRFVSPDTSGAGDYDYSHSSHDHHPYHSKSNTSNYHPKHNRKNPTKSTSISSQLDRRDSITNFNRNSNNDMNISTFQCSMPNSIASSYSFKSSKKIIETKEKEIQTSFLKFGNKRRNFDNDIHNGFNNNNNNNNKRRRKNNNNNNINNNKIQSRNRKRKRISCSPNSCRPRSKIRKNRGYCKCKG